MLNGGARVGLAEKPSQERTVWEFQTESTNWTEYHDKDAEELEAKYQGDQRWSGRMKLGPKSCNYKIDFRSMSQVNPKTSKQRAIRRQVLGSVSNWNLPIGMKLVLFTATTALDGWRIFLRSAVPEEMPVLAPGDNWIWYFFLRAHSKELMLSWKLRTFGLLLMMAGVEIAFFGWEARLAVFGGMFINYGLLAIAFMAAAGFTALTVAAASLYYRPIAASLHILSAIAIFTALFGGTKLIIALIIVGSCMAVLSLLFAVHLVLPC